MVQEWTRESREEVNMRHVTQSRDVGGVLDYNITVKTRKSLRATGHDEGS